MKSAVTPATQDEIELFRGLAACAVVLAHYIHFYTPQITMANFSYTGVDLFFVLSGYVFAPYLVERRRIAVLPHLVRRFFRLYPLYLVALFCYAAIKGFDDNTGYYLSRHALMLHTTVSKEEAFYFNPAFWSLPPEVEFYILLPLFSFLCRKRFYFVALVIAAILLRVAIALTLQVHYSESVFIASKHLPGILAEFLMGSLAFLLAGWLRRRESTVLALIVVLLGASIVVSLGRIAVSLLARGGEAMLASSGLEYSQGCISALGYALILSGAIGLRIAHGKRVKTVAAFAGGISYGVYLFHNAMPFVISKLMDSRITASIATTSAVATLLFAYLSFRYFENPMREKGRLLAARLERNTPRHSI